MSKSCTGSQFCECRQCEEVKFGRKVINGLANSQKKVAKSVEDEVFNRKKQKEIFVSNIRPSNG